MSIDEGDQSTLNIKLTNHLTGEITEVEVKSAEQAKNLLLELAASTRVINKAQDSLKYYLERFLGDEKEYQFADGKVLRKAQRISMSYRVETLRKYLDSDQVDVCLKVDTTAANQLISEMVEKGELPPDTLKKIREEADHHASKEWIEVR